MALPQKVIEQLGREPPKTPGWSGQLLIFSSTVFAVTLFIYLGLTFGYQSYLQSGVDKLQDQIQSFGQQIPVDEQAKLINFYSQIANLQSLISKHIVSSRAFAWLEKNTQANVYVSEFSLDAAGSKLTLGLNAATMPDVLQQIAIFESLPEVQSIDISGTNFSGNWWRFGAVIKLAPGYFNYGSGNPVQSSQG
jgi:hypothetical protein